MKKEIKTENAPEALGPYSQGIIASNTIYLSGQIPINRKTGEIPDSIEEQTRQVMNNIMAILESQGKTMANIVKTTLIIKKMEDFQTINEIYESYFENPFPARTCFEASKLPKDVMIEIDVVAVI